MPHETFEVDGRPEKAPRYSVDRLDSSGLPEEDQEKIRAGHELAELNPALPEDRPARDTGWFVAFVAAIVTTVACFAYLLGTANLGEKFRDPKLEKEAVPWSKILLTALGAATVALASIFASLTLMRRHPTLMVWAGLIFPPVLFGMSALLCLFMGDILRAVMFALCAFPCLFVISCWRHLIPFTSLLISTAVDVANRSPLLYPLSMLACVLSVSALVFMSAGCALAHLALQQLAFPSEGVQTAAGMTHLCILFFVFMSWWVAQVIGGAFYMTCSGVFARWYYRRNQEAPIVSSGHAAFKSIGSVCFGGCIIAIVRTLEFLARQTMNSEDMIAKIIGCMIMSILSCVGDLLEYLNKWAYVQCALRGTGFMDSVQIACGVATGANLQYMMSGCISDSVLALITVLIGLKSAVGGALVGWLVMSHSTGNAKGSGIAMGGLIGLVVGMLGAQSMTEIFSSGIKTMLMLWAEDTEPLERWNLDLHKELVAKALGTPVTAHGAKKGGEPLHEEYS